jgi:hypothetical protein
MPAVEEPRTFTGWKVGLTLVAITIVVFSALNLAGRAARDSHPHDTPAPSVTYVTP